jgi:hypothetical protein
MPANRHEGRDGSMADRATQASMGRSESLLFLTDEQLRQGIEAMFFAYRGFTADPDRILRNTAMAARITGRSISSTARRARR